MVQYRLHKSHGRCGTLHIRCNGCLFVNFVGLLDLNPKRGMDKYLLENYAAMEIHPGNLLKAPIHHNLVELFTGSTPQAQFFCTHIHKFNSQFAMASLIIDHDVTVSNRLGGAAAFCIMGQLHQKVGAVHGNYGRYIQTYSYDVQQQNQQCKAAFPQQHQQWALEIVDKIQVALEESNNTYTQTFKSIHQIESEIEETTQQSIETIQLALHAEKTK